MNLDTIDRRLKELETKGRQRISTYMDYTLWYNTGQDPDAIWDPIMLEMVDAMEKYAKAQLEEAGNTDPKGKSTKNCPKTTEMPAVKNGRF